MVTNEERREVRPRLDAATGVAADVPGDTAADAPAGTAASAPAGTGTGTAAQPGVDDGGEHRSATCGTRERIQEVALDLFTENGYEATSLREIAERLGVTKAALYYHFKTKDDIVASLIAQRVTRMRELVAWAQGQPRSPQTRRELLYRYSDMLRDGEHHRLMRFFERNQASVPKHKAASSMRDQMTRLSELLCDPARPLTAQVTCSLAILALHAGFHVDRCADVSDEQRLDAGLTVALDLVERANQY